MITREHSKDLKFEVRDVVVWRVYHLAADTGDTRQLVMSLDFFKKLHTAGLELISQSSLEPASLSSQGGVSLTRRDP